METIRKIIHCDCDCFFAAVEMRDNPALVDIPLAVGGDPSRRGVIATCNYPAREYGVRSAMASAQALKLCPQLTIVPGNMDRYREASAEIQAIFRDYTELIEPLSLDEAYLDVSQVQACRGSATLIAQEIRQRVRQSVGITISAGVAPNKFLAKIASDWDKPDGLFVIKPDEVDSFVRGLPVSKLAGVGPATLKKLQRRGIETCDDLRAFQARELVQWFGRFGQRLYDLSHGIDERPVVTSRRRKSVSVEQTYSRDLADLSDCLAHLPPLLEKLEQRWLRLQGYSITGAVVKVKFDNFVQTTVEQQASTLQPSIFHELLEQGFLRTGRPVRLLGVGLRLRDHASGASCRQLSLFAGDGLPSE